MSSFSVVDVVGACMQRSVICAGVLLCAFFTYFFWFQPSIEYGVPTLRIYNWAHYIPSSVIKKFEFEEGVHVQYAVFDALETLEAKLLAARSGYDVVFPPILPTGGVFAPAGAFSKLKLKKLPNYKHLDPAVMSFVKRVDPKGRYFIPYLWGTTGFVYHKHILSHFKNAPLDSWNLLFSRNWVRRLAPFHVVLLDSPADVLPDLLMSKGYGPDNFSPNLLSRAMHYLWHIMPFIYKFSSSETLQDMLAERIAVAEIFSSYAHMAIAQLRKQKGKSPYKYVIPKEGALMWIDVMAIPKDAPNKDLAHRFINFLMRPDVMAEVTNKIFAANAIPASKPFLKSWIRDNDTIYPSRQIMRRLHLDKIPSRAYERKRLHYWALIKSGYAP